MVRRRPIHPLLQKASGLIACLVMTCLFPSAMADYWGNGGGHNWNHPPQNSNVYNWVGTPWYDGWSDRDNWAGGVAPPSNKDDPAARNTILNFGTGDYSF